MSAFLTRRRLGRQATSLTLMLVVALGVRLGFAWSRARQTPNSVLSVVPFQTETGHIAYSLAAGKGFSSPFQKDTGATAWLAPVYPLLLAAIFKVFGIYTVRAFYAAVILNCLLSAAVCVPLFYAGQRVAGLTAATVAVWMWVFFPNAVMMPFEWVWDTSLSVFLAATILWATLVVADSRKRGAWCGYGLLWGVSLLTNPSLGACMPALLVWVAYRTRQRKLAWELPVLAAMLAVLCCIPWTARNYVLFHRLVPLRSNFPFELYIGNNENYEPARRQRPAMITHDREILRYLRMGEMPFMDEEKHKAVAFMVTHPAVEMELIGRRFVDFWLGTAYPIDTFKQANSRTVRAILFCNFLLPFVALVGVVLLLREKNPLAIPIVAFVVFFPMVYYVTHTSLRYRHPLDPVLLLLAAIAMVRAGTIFVAAASQRVNQLYNARS
jgi:4-amino-4-deoxy-L-arabinose transferase-like glycosyltransferase